MDDPLWEAHAYQKEEAEKKENEFLALKKQVKELTARLKELEQKLVGSEERRKDPEKYFWTH